MTPARAALVALASVIVLAACGDPNVKGGAVLDKEHAPSYVTFMYVRKSMVPQFHPDKWSLTIRDCSTDVNGKCHTGDVDVDEATYNRVHVGDTWPKP